MKLRKKLLDPHITLAFGLIIAIAMLVSSTALQAQTSSTFTTGLNGPVKVITAGQSSLLVAESGTLTPNNGRISLVRNTGERTTLVDGLPSGVNRSGGAPESSGPSGLKLNGLKLYMTIGAGDTAVPVTGGATANPTPSSPLFDSVLELTLPADYETLASGFTLSAANQTTLNGGGPVTLTNAEGKQLTVRLVANLPNFVIEPRPTVPLNIRESNLFGVEISGDFLYVVDASFNLLQKIDIATGATETFATFASKPNPTPVGPPFIEAVPDSIRLVGNDVIISFLTGFPFVAGLAEVRKVNLATAAQSVLISNLTTAIDVLSTAQPGSSGDPYLVLEYSSNFLAQAPGRLKLLSTPTATPIILSSTLVTPTSIARDSRNGFIYVTERSPGRVLRIVNVTAAGVSVSGRVTTSDGRGLRNAEVSITDSNGLVRTATTSSFGYYSFEDVAAGDTYVIAVTSRRYRFASRLVQLADAVTEVNFVGTD